MRPFLLVAAIATLTVLAPAQSSPFGDRHVLIIGIDGVRSDALRVARTPNLDGLALTGAVTWDAFAGGALAVNDPTHQATSSGPGWSSFLTGVWVDLHGVASNGEFTSGPHNLAAHPHLFGLLRPLYPTAWLSSIVQWHPINAAMLDPWPGYASFTAEVADSGQAVAAAAVAHLGSADPDVLFLHFDDVDHAGHASGFDPTSGPYVAAIEQTDRHVGGVLQAVRARPNYLNEDWLVLVSTDHGGIGTSHGGHSPQERTIWIIASGGAVENAVFSPGPGHTVITRTALEHLGVQPSASWQLADADPFGYAKPSSSWPAPPDGAAHVALEVELTWVSGQDAIAQEVFFGVDPTPDQGEFQGRQAATRFRPGPLSMSTRYFWRIDTITASGRVTGPVWSFDTVGVLTDDQVLHLQFEFDARDASGRGHHGTIHGNPTFVTGRLGSAIALDGSGDFVTVAHGPDLAFGATTDFTIALWIRSPGWAGDAAFVSNKDWNSGGNQGYVISGETGGADWQWNYKGALASRADLDRIGIVGAGTGWHHVAVVHDRDGPATFYQDGVEMGRVDIAGHGDIDTGMPLVLGQDGTLGYAWSLQADVDELRVWRRALGAIEVETLARPTATAPQPQDGAAGIGDRPLLSWTPAHDAVAHDVYFGTTPSLGSAHLQVRTPAAMFTPGALAAGSIYYWRVDTVTPNAVRRGDPWLFRTAPALTTDEVVRLEFEGDVLDSSARGNHGSTIGDPRFVGGTAGQAIELDGSTDAVSLGTSADLSFGTATDFSIALWIRTNGWTGDPPICSNKDWASGHNRGWVIAGDYDGRSWQWNYRGATAARRDFDRIGDIADGRWHHLAVVHDRDGDASFFQDGRLVGRVAIAGSGSIDSGLPTAIGEDGTSSYGDDLPADLDRFRIWRRALGAQEVAGLFLADASSGFHDLGGSALGTFGQATLTGTGALRGNDPLLFEVAGAYPNAPALLVLSTRARFAALGGGVLIPELDAVVPLGIDAQGRAAFAAIWPPGVPARTTLFAQVWFGDPAAALGLGATPGVVAITP